MPLSVWQIMENKGLLKLVLTSGSLFLTGLSLFIIFARDQAQEFYGLTSTTVTGEANFLFYPCLLYTSPSPRDTAISRMPSSA